MYRVMWEFRVRAGAEREFIDGYAPEGAWATLFRQASGYRGTELLRSVRGAGVFYTLDSWESEADYRAFLADHRGAYDQLDRQFEGLTEQERLVGVLDPPSAARKEYEENHGEGKV